MVRHAPRVPMCGIVRPLLHLQRALKAGRHMRMVFDVSLASPCCWMDIRSDDPLLSGITNDGLT